MRIIRPLLLGVACLVGLTFVLIGIAVTPPVQEWAARRILSSSTGADSVAFDSASVGLSSLTLENLQLKRAGVVLSAPTIRLTLPVKAALQGRAFAVESLTAKGWILDLTRPPAVPTNAGTAATATRVTTARAPGANDSVPAEAAAAAIHQWLKEFSITGTCAGVALEGDVLVPSAGKPASVHVVLSGGKLAPQTTADFAFDLTTEPIGRLSAIRAQGRLKATISHIGHLDRLQFTGLAAPEGVRIPADLHVAAEFALATPERPDTYALRLSRADHEVVAFDAAVDAAARRLQGHWAVDLRDVDAARLAGSTPVPFAAAKGRGPFDASTDFANVHVSGQLTLTALPVTLGLPNPGALRALSGDGTFDLRRENGATTVTQLDFDLVGNAPIGHVRLLQPCRIDTGGTVSATNPDTDALELKMEALPLALLFGTGDAFRLLGSSVAGTVRVKAAPGSLLIHSTTPLVAKGATLRGPESLVIEGLDLSTSFTATRTDGQGWTTHAAPLSVATGGHDLLTLDATLRSVPDAYGRYPVTGTWKIDPARAAEKGASRLVWLAAAEASGEFTANLGAAADFTVKFNVTAADHSRAISGTVSAAVDDYTALTLRAPVQIKAGAETADVSIEGKWRMGADAQKIDLQVSANGLTLEQLQTVGALPRPTAPAAPQPGTDSRAASRPFWAPLVGRVRFDLGQLKTKDREFTNLGGTLSLAANALELTGGRARFIPQPPKGARPRGDEEVRLEPSSTYSLEGTIAFEPNGTQPYRLQGTAAVDLVTTQRLFGWSAEKPDAVVEGHWAITDTLRGTGADLDDLLTHREDELKLLSQGGTLRLLRTSIADAIPDETTPVTDTLATIGFAAGKIFGRRGNTIAGQRKLPAATEALLNFTYQTKEIGYEKLALTVTRDRDGTLRLSNIEIIAPNERLTGTGTIYHAPDHVFSARPFSLDLELAFRGVAAERLGTAGLLAADKDAEGFRKLRQRIPFAGTLDQIDNREWHDLLAKAAAPPPAK